MPSEKVVEDITEFAKKLSEGVNEEAREELRRLAKRAIELYAASIVKTSHALMELLCARFLLASGYRPVELEKGLTEVLVCDVFGVKGEGSFIIEVETGFVPPEGALSPLRYCAARIASKVARYSHYASRFAIAVPPYYVPPIDPALLKPPKLRSDEEVTRLKSLCDLYYKRPPVTPEEIKYARLHSVLVLNIDEAEVKVFSPEDFVSRYKLPGT